MSHDTSTDERTRQIFCAHGSYTQTPEQNSKQKNKKGSSCNSHLFTYDRKDHIILRFRNKAQLLNTVSKSPAKNPAASDRIQSLNRLESFLIFLRIFPDCQTFQTIALCRQKDSNKSDSCTAKPDKLIYFGFDAKIRITPIPSI